MDKEKRNPADFALWFKLEGKFKKHLLHWPSPWGEGFPGWHIECSAISRHFLGQPFDIHTGGVDHIGTHHTNEIAQSEAAYGAPLADLWMHGEHLLIGEDGKMAKSEGNFFTLDDLRRKKDMHPLIFRYLIARRALSHAAQLHLGKPGGGAERHGTALPHYLRLSVRWQSWRKTTKAREWTNPRRTLKNYEKLFADALEDDLNTPRALAVLQEMLD